MEENKKYLRIFLNILIPLSGLYFVCFLGPRVLGFFMPFVIGWVIALIANPLVRILERRLRLVRRHSSAMIIVTVLGAILGILYLAVSRLYLELAGFAADFPVLLENAAAEISDAVTNGNRLLEFLPGSLKTSMEEFSSNLGSYAGTLVSKAALPTVEIAGNLAKKIPNILVNTIITIFSAYIFTAEQDQMIQWLYQYTPDFVRKYVEYLKKDAKGLIGGYFLAQFRIMFVVALILIIGFFILGVRYGVFFGILIAMLDFLPIFGTGTVLIPWAVIKLFTGSYAYGAGLLLLYVTTQVVRQIIQPKIVGDSMGLSPLTTLFLLYLGFKVRGIAGMILAVPIGMIFINFYKYGAFHSLINAVREMLEEIENIRKK